MQRLVRDFVELEDGLPLAELIARLTRVQQGLPDDAAEATVRAIGDDLFGHKISISYLRPQSLPERLREARYSVIAERVAA